MENRLNNPMIKLEIECSNVNIKPVSTVTNLQSLSSNNNNNNNNLQNNNKLVNSGTNQQQTSTVTATTTTNSGTKMGSRRIFPPQFKLQVLESYRNDSDCKGNQRATARKYGIHRRQIQKWLQCENNLRSSVANLNQNNMKHQFHNISHHHHQQQHQHNQQIPVVSSSLSSSSSATVITTTHTMTINNNNNNNNSNNNNQQYKTNVLSLDTARHTVGLTPRPMTVQLPLPVAPIATTSPIATPSTVMAAMTPNRLSSITATTTTTKCSSGSTAGPLGTATSVTSSSSSSLKSPTHTITKIQAPPYNINMPVVPVADTLLTHTPAISSISSVPLVHHYPHHHQQHHHSQQHHVHNEQQQHQQQQQQQQSHQHYQHPPLPPPPHQQQHHENCLLMPSASLPMPNSNSPSILTATNRTDELRDYQPITMTENCYIKDEYNTNHETYDNFNYYTNESGYIAPIDLSLGPRRTVYQQDNIQVRTEYTMNENKPHCENTQINVWPEIETNNNECKNICIKNEIQNTLQQIDSQAIDLTCRKRKNYSDSDATIEKVSRICSNSDIKEPTDVDNVKKCEPTGIDNNNSQQPKPVKLFKPYLLDDDDEVDDKKKVKTETSDPIIWSHHPNCTSPTSSPPTSSSAGAGVGIYHDKQSYHGNFQSNERSYSFQSGSPTFQKEFEHNNFTRATTSTPSPSNFITRTSPPIGTAALWCPKGSPVSGYETSSNYSDSSDYIYRTQQQSTSSFNPHHHNHHPQQQQHQQQHYPSQCQTYSLDLKMQTIENSYYYDMTCRGDQLATVNDKYHMHKNDVQRWLDHEADIRQGIAVYV